MDRNWNEILQELRVTQTGTQVLTGFLLTIAFQPKFAELDAFQHSVYLVLVVTAVLTTALGLAPVRLHRGLFRKHAKQVVVEMAHIVVQITLAGVALVLAGTLLLIFDVAVGRGAALVAGGGESGGMVVLAISPRLLRRIRVAQRPARSGAGAGGGGRREGAERGGPTARHAEEEEVAASSATGPGGGMDAGRKTPGPSVKDDEVYEAIREQGGSKEKAARIANASAARGRSAVGRKGGEAGSYEDWTVDDLRQRAKELGLSGYSGKRKGALIEMLREH